MFVFKTLHFFQTLRLVLLHTRTHTRTTHHNTTHFHPKMAELAAGAVVAEQVVSTAVEGGAVAGYAIAKSTFPLKATFTQIGRTDSKFLNDSTSVLHS